MAPTFWLLVAMRAAQGIGASVMFVIGPAMIKALFADVSQARAFAVYSTGPMAGLCAGPGIGGQITALLGWQSVFFITLAVTAVTWVLLRGV
jgi:predicted MFS family arabinose efflux permease